MQDIRLTIGYVEDDEDDFILIEDIARRTPQLSVELRWIASFAAAIELVDCADLDLLLVDYRLGSHTGLDLLKATPRLSYRCPIIIVTGQGDEQVDDEAMRLGAADYLVKGQITPDLFRRTVLHALERRRSQEDLRVSESLHRAIFEQAAVPIGRVAADGSWRLVNPALHQLLAIGQTDLAETRLSDFLAPEDAARIAAYMAREANDERIDLDLLIHPRQGEPRWTRTLLAAVEGAAGGPRERSYVLVIRDRHDQILAEQALREAERSQRERIEEALEVRTRELLMANAELRRAATMKDEFLATMSHELRTPLNTVLALTEVLIDQVFGELNEQQKTYLETVQQSGQHLLELITDILDVAKIESGRFEMAWEPVELAVLVESSFNLVRQQAQRKNIELEERIAAPAVRVRGDARRLKQALVNLLMNAVKFTPEGGKAGFIVTTDVVDESVRIEVWDTGIGIPRAKQDALFEPFVQADSSLSREQQGTGLGLALVLRLIRLHCGSIQLHSKEGQGSRFILTLPWPYAAGKGTPDGPRRETSGSGVILIAERDPNCTDLLSNAATRLGLASRCVATASDLDVGLREQPPAVMLLDSELPLIGGVEVLRRLRADEATRALPVIALCSLDRDRERDALLTAGADLVTTRPLGMRKLHGLLQQLDLA